MPRIRRRHAMPRSTASGDSSFMSPPPCPRRTTSFSRVSVSKRSAPTARATTRWKLFVPMSSAARTGASPSSEADGLVRGAVTAASVPGATVSVSDHRRARVDPIEHTLAEAGDLLEAAAEPVVVRGLVPDDERGLDRLVEITRLDGRGAPLGRAVGTGDRGRRPRTGEAVIREESSLARQGAAHGRLAGLAPRAPEDVADDEVAEAIVEVPR